jgi:AcrR family transcriptional regulator
MRVTAAAKEATRQTIMDVSRNLLCERGWEEVSTRDIAAAAGIANGTLFNYFPTKEAVAAALVAAALAAANDGQHPDLYTLIFAGLRKLKPYRCFLPGVIDAVLSRDGDRIREDHLSAVERLTGGGLTGVQRHLYWSLYSGILAFWVRDASPKQEQTLALVDQSVRLFVASLERSSHERRPAASSLRAPAGRRR